MSQEKASGARQLGVNFSEEDVNTLIDTVEAVPMLWDASNSDYKSRSKRESMWQTIADDTFGGRFAVTGLQLKRQSLRTQFKTYYAKSVETKSGQAAKRPVSWKYFKKMMFIQCAEEQQTPVSESNLVNIPFLSLY